MRPNQPCHCLDCRCKMICWDGEVVCVWCRANEHDQSQLAKAGFKGWACPGCGGRCHCKTVVPQSVEEAP